MVTHADGRRMCSIATRETARYRHLAFQMDSTANALVLHLLVGGDDLLPVLDWLSVSSTGGQQDEAFQRVLVGIQEPATRRCYLEVNPRSETPPMCSSHPRHCLSDLLRTRAQFEACPALSKARIEGDERRAIDVAFATLLVTQDSSDRDPSRCRDCNRQSHCESKWRAAWCIACSC